MFRSALLFAGLSLVNPLCMAASFCVCMAMDVYQPRPANEAAFDARFFPVYLTVGMLVLLLQWLLVDGLARLRYRGRPVTLVKVAGPFLSSQKPFFFLVIFLPLLLGVVEGNCLAFGIIYAFPFILIAGFFTALILSRKLRAAVEGTSEDNPAVAKGITRATAAALCVSLAVIAIYGPNNGFGEWLVWRSDTPQYAIRQVSEALQAGDLARLESYVDLDDILAQSVAIGGPGRADLLDALASGQRAGDAQPQIRYKEWILDPLRKDYGRESGLLGLRKQNGDFGAVIAIESEVTGQSFLVDFAMKSTRGRYRITSAGNLAELARSHKEEQDKIRQTVAIAEQAKAKSRALVEVHVLSVQAAGESSQFALQVANKGDVPIGRVQCVVVVTRKDSGAAVRTEMVWPDFSPGHLAPGRAERTESWCGMPADVVAKIESGRLVVADALPVKIEFADDRVVELVKLPD